MLVCVNVVMATHVIISGGNGKVIIPVGPSACVSVSVCVAWRVALLGG